MAPWYVACADGVLLSLQAIDRLDKYKPSDMLLLFLRLMMRTIIAMVMAITVATMSLDDRHVVTSDDYGRRRCQNHHRHPLPRPRRFHRPRPRSRFHSLHHHRSYDNAKNMSSHYQQHHHTNLSTVESSFKQVKTPRSIESYSQV